MLHIVLREEGT